MIAGGRESQVAGAAQLKDHLLTSVHLNGASSEGKADGAYMLASLAMTGAAKTSAQSLSMFTTTFSLLTISYCIGRIFTIKLQNFKAEV